MVSVLILETKNHPRINEFIGNCDQVLQIQKFERMSSNPLTYINTQNNFPMNRFNSCIGMIKGFDLYKSCVKKMHLGHNLRTVQ